MFNMEEQITCITHLWITRNKTNRDSSNICSLFNLSATEIGDVVSRNISLLFEGQSCESAIFRKFMRDYLANAGRYDTSCIVSLNGIWYLNLQITCIYLTVTNCKCQHQGHAYFEQRISWKLWNKWQTPRVPENMKSSLAFDWHIYIWSWPVLKVKVNVTHILTVNILEMVTDLGKVTMANK